jgi:hypothetical protein
MRARESRLQNLVDIDCRVGRLEEHELASVHMLWNRETALSRSHPGQRLDDEVEVEKCIIPIDVSNSSTDLRNGCHASRPRQSSRLALNQKAVFPSAIEHLLTP